MTRKLRTLCSNRPGTKNANPLLTSRISEAAPRSSSIPQAPLAPQAPGFCKLRLARTVSVFRKSFHAPSSSSNYHYSHTSSLPLTTYYRQPMTYFLQSPATTMTITATTTATSVAASATATITLATTTITTLTIDCHYRYDLGIIVQLQHDYYHQEH